MATNQFKAHSFPLLNNQTASVNGSDLVNDGFRGVKVFINVNSVSGGNVTVNIEQKAPASDAAAYDNILSSASLTSTGLTVLTVYPGVTAAANVAVSDVLPTIWRVTTTAAATIDYTISFCYIP